MGASLHFWEDRPGVWLGAQANIIDGWYCEAVRGEGGWRWSIYAMGRLPVVKGVAETLPKARNAIEQAMKSLPGRGRPAPSWAELMAMAGTADSDGVGASPLFKQTG